METTEPFAGPVLLEACHELSSFDCGVEALDLFLHKHALNNIRNHSARTYVVLRGITVVGYYTLTAGSVSKAMSRRAFPKASETIRSRLYC